MFAKKQIVFGDNPLMRWFTNNVAVKMQPDGSKKYIKKDEVRRLTSSFLMYFLLPSGCIFTATLFVNHRIKGLSPKTICFFANIVSIRLFSGIIL